MTFKIHGVEGFLTMSVLSIPRRDASFRGISSAYVFCALLKPLSTFEITVHYIFSLQWWHFDHGVSEILIFLNYPKGNVLFFEC